MASYEITRIWFQGYPLLHTLLFLLQPTIRNKSLILPRHIPGNAPSRTRLVKNLGPSSSSRKSGKLEVAPPPERESAPHLGRDPRVERAPVRRLGTREQDLLVNKDKDKRRPRSLSADRSQSPRRPWARDQGRDAQPPRRSWGREQDRDGVPREPRMPADRSQRRPWGREQDGVPADRSQRSWGREQGRDGIPREPRMLPADSSQPPRRSWGREQDHDAASQEPSQPKPKAKVVNPLSDEFDIATRSVSTKELPKEFTAPPLMDGLLTSVFDVLGADARPTPIQALSLKHLVKEHDPEWYYEHLLASETGSGKSIAYLLPMLQDLKQSELNGTQRAFPDAERSAINPRAIVLAPTHELTRQLAGFAKELLHHSKLRVLCASRANTASRKNVSASKMADMLVEGEDGGLGVSSELMMRSDHNHAVDIVVGTPAKVLELMRGRGWDHDAEENADKRSRRKVTIGEPQMGLGNVEWVVVDEADVLLDPDFQEATRSILAEISSARGHPIPFDPNLDLSLKGLQTPIKYPFNFVLTSATIPSSLAVYLDKFHPTLTRLASPHLHRLPSTLMTEHVSWTGGNRDADIERRLRRVWFEDMQATGRKSKVLVFCNKGARVENLGAALAEKGIANVALTRAGDARKRGSNHHLDGFLRVRDGSATSTSSPAPARATGAGSMDDLKEVPHVMITTSLLSRGLDFSPDVKHVFIVDEPRNMVDFLHRAGRSGRAGESGKVVVFGKTKGRGSDKARVVRKKVGALAA